MLALATTTFAWLIFLVFVIGYALYAIANVRAGRREVGSEIELAANRKQYYDDETLEGPKLERTQLLAVVFLAMIALSLPIYWLFEPQRQANAIEGWNKRFASQGGDLFAPTADGGFNCAGCHGGMRAGGGSAPYTVTDPNTGEVKAVTWTAPALNTVFYKYSESEVRFILEYGRPFSPMSPWGLAGGGPMNDQQIQNLLEYLKSIQIPREECLAQVEDTRNCEGGHLPTANQQEIQAAAEQAVADGRYATLGEALFNLELASGSYSCARCHTSGWSFGDPKVSGQGAFGWNLTGGSTNVAFANEQDMIDFIKNGSEYGKQYGNQRQGSGRMPGFGNLLTDAQIKAIVEYVRSL
jgi:mono/diheme cytochrome c family protein